MRQHQENQDKSYVGMDLCFYCQEPKGVVLNRRLANTLPRAAVYDRTPCDKCKEWMSQGIILISFSEKLTTDLQNPYRTGGWAVVTEDAAKKMFTSHENIMRMRFAFVTNEAWVLVGLPEIPRVN